MRWDYITWITVTWICHRSLCPYQSLLLDCVEVGLILWVLGCMGIGLSNIHILWFLLSLTPGLCCCNSLSSSSGLVTKAYGNFWFPLIPHRDFEESPTTPGAETQPLTLLIHIAYFLHVKLVKDFEVRRVFPRDLQPPTGLAEGRGSTALKFSAFLHTYWNYFFKYSFFPFYIHFRPSDLPEFKLEINLKH